MASRHCRRFFDVLHLTPVLHFRPTSRVPTKSSRTNFHINLPLEHVKPTRYPLPSPRTTLIAPAGFHNTLRSPVYRNNAYQASGHVGIRCLHTSRSNGQNYRRFDGSRASGFVHLFRRWAARRTFYYELGGLGVAVGIFYTVNLESVPLSGRRRFNMISPAWEAQISQSQYQAVLSQYEGAVLPEHDARTQQVRRVLSRLVAANEDLQTASASWTVHVLDTKEANAFVIPGGHVFVFAGILPVCDDEAGLATVLAHELGHTLAHHIAESMSRGWLLLPFVFLLDLALGVPANVTSVLLTLGFENPGSRRQESEADGIGLLLMSQACYDPRSAVAFWERMHDAAQQGGGEIPQFLSTHPSHGTREKAIQDLLPQAEQRREKAGCGAAMESYVDAFRGRKDEWF